MKRLLAVLFACAGLAPAQIYGPPQTQVYAPSRLLQKVGINQKMGGQIPLDLPFVDESGKDATLRQYFGKPVILALVYYQCPSLCNMVLNGVLRSIKQLDLTAGTDYEVIAVSFDPRETPEMAAAKKQTYLRDYKRQGAEQGWHFLTGPETSSKALADSVGFRYIYDALTNQYAHSSAIMVLTPAGRIDRYFYGIEYPARDVRLGLVEASNERIGTPTDQVLLYCFHYDPTTGKYALVVMNVLRLAALITVVVLATFMIVMFRRDFRSARSQRGTA
ncbi:MAG TPA: SCO family protein [Bryobacteraceae bacterium]|jgi:protein SCO1/2|nr:SCO family protein [Bryobacteraceae bacterium]